MATAAKQEEAPWHAAFPAPKSTVSTISRTDFLDSIKAGKKAGKDLILVDLRRNDHEGGTIRGSLNLPAQSLYHSLPTLYTLARAAGVEKVIWYCGSSQGRGSRAASWFADYIKERREEGDDVGVLESLALEGGIKGWVKAGDEYIETMDGYDESVWTK